MIQISKLRSASGTSSVGSSGSPFASEAAQAAGPFRSREEFVEAEVGVIGHRPSEQLCARRLQQLQQLQVVPPPASPAAGAFTATLATDPHVIMNLLACAKAKREAVAAAEHGASGGAAAAGGATAICSSYLHDGMLHLPGEAPVPLTVDFKQEIEPYLGRMLGKGGYGVVYEATWRGERVSERWGS